MAKSFLLSFVCTHAIFLDFAKAFDTVPHERLLLKLDNVGVRGPLYVPSLPIGGRVYVLLTWLQHLSFAPDVVSHTHLIRGMQMGNLAVSALRASSTGGQFHTWGVGHQERCLFLACKGKWDDLYQTCLKNTLTHRSCGTE